MSFYVILFVGVLQIVLSRYIYMLPFLFIVDGYAAVYLTFSMCVMIANKVNSKLIVIFFDFHIICVHSTRKKN